MTTRRQWTKLRGPAASLRSLRPAIQTGPAATGAEGPYARVYGSRRWQALRAELTQAHPYCARCGKRGGRLYCDHRVELKDGGPAFDRANIEVLCASCHATKTNAVRRSR